MKTLRRLLTLESMERRITPADLFWTGNGLGEPQVWSNPSNWGGKSIQVNDRLHFQAGSGVVLNSICDITVNLDGLIIDASWTGNIINKGHIATFGDSSWSGNNTISFEHPAAVWVNIVGTLTLDTTGSPLLTGGDFQNLGVVVQSGNGNLRYSAGATIENDHDWYFTNNSGIDYVGGAEPLFQNHGAVYRTAATGETKIEGGFETSGIIEVQGGTLNLFPDGATNGSSAGGDFKIAAGATLNLNGGQYRKLGGSWYGYGGGTILLAGGTIDITSGSAFYFPPGMFRWTGGTINGFAFSNHGQITIDTTGPGTPTLGKDGFIENKSTGTITITGNDNFVIQATSVIENRSGGTIDIQGDVRLDYQGVSPAPIIVNAGLIKRSAGTGAAYIEGDFRNEGGTIQVDSGNLTLFPDGATGTSTGGTFNVATGAVLDLTGGNINQSRTLQGTYTGAGGGRIQLTGGTLSGGTGATFNFPAGMFHWTDGYLAGSVTNKGFITVNTDIGYPTLDFNATLINQGTVTLTGNYAMYIRTSSVLDNQATGTLDFQGNVIVDWEGSDPAPIVVNTGLVRRSAGSGVAVLQGDFRNHGGTIQVDTGTLALASGSATGVDGLSTGGTFNVATGATLDLAGYQTYTRTLQGTYTGSGGGTVQLSTGTLYAGTGATFNFASGMFRWIGGNLGGGTLTSVSPMTIDTDTYTPQILGGATFVNKSIVTFTGDYYLVALGNAVILNDVGATWNVSGNARVDWVGTSPAPIFTNRGLIRRSAGNDVARIDGDFRNEGGTIQVDTGTFILFPDSAPSAVSNGGTFNVAPGATLNLNGGQARTLQGTYTGSGGGTITAFGGQLSAGTGATFNFPPGMLQFRSTTLDTGTFTNTGSLAFDGGSYFAATASFVNQGNVTITDGFVGLTSGALTTNDTAGVWDFQGDGDVYWAVGSVTPVVNNKGIIRKSAGTGVSLFDGDLTNTGTVQVQTGTLRLDYGSMTSSGTIDVNAGAAFNTPGTTNITGGIVRGGGTIADPLNVTGGAVRPGASPGTLTVNGNYTQSNPGTLDVELNGIIAGTEYDQLKVNGTVSLGGPLAISAGYSAKAGDSFKIIDNNGTSDAVIGTFAGLAEGGTVSIGGSTATISYKGGDGNDVVLTVTGGSTVVNAKVTNVQLNDGSAQRSRVTSMKVTFDNPPQFPGSPAAAFQLKRQLNNELVTLAASVSGNSVTLSFSGAQVESNSLADGRYTLTVLASQVPNLDGDGNGTAGDDYVLAGTPANGLFRKFGDSNGDGTVNGVDFLAFRLAFLGTDGAFDFDGSGQVNGNDFLQFRLRFLQMV